LKVRIKNSSIEVLETTLNSKKLKLNKLCPLLNP
jgi:hypothetical protein